jgi:uncharacterized protein
MESIWRAAGYQLGRHWKLVALGVVAITAVLLVGLAQLNFATGQDSYLNKDSQAAIDNVEFQDQFGGETVVLLFTADDDHDVSDLFSGTNLAELERITAELEAIPETFAVITPRVSIEWSDALLKGPGRDALLAAAARDPDPDGVTARNADIQIGLARLGAATDQQIGNPEWADLLIFGNDGFTVTDGNVVAPADEDRAIRLSLASTFPSQKVAVGGVVLAGNATLDEQSAGTEQVLEVLDTADFEGFELITTGSPVYLREINDYLKGGLVTLGLIAIAVMAVILLFLFRVRWRLLPLVSVVFGVIWAFSLLGLIGIDLSLVTISGLPILIGLGIDFSIQIQNRVDEEAAIDRDPHPISESLANVGPALVAAAVGAALAFLALQISQVPMIRDFGIMLAIGVILLLVAGIVLSASVLGVREYRSTTDIRKPSMVERIVVRLGSLPAKLGPLLVVAAVALFAVGVAVEGQTKIESDPIRWIDQGSQTVADVNTLEERTGFSTTLGVLVEANNVLDENVNDLIWQFTLDAEQRPDVVTSSSVVNTMGKILLVPGATALTPTPSELQAAIDVMPPAIARALLNDDGTAAQLNLRLAGASLEERADIVAELETDLDSRIDAIDLAPDSILAQGLDAGDPPVRAVPAGLAVVGVGLLENLSANRAILTYLGLAIVALWLLLRFRSFSRTALALVPVSLAVGISSIIVGLLGITLSPLTTVGGPLVIATCTEFAVLILARYLEERERGLVPVEATQTASGRTGRAFFTSAATTIGGFAVLMVSPLPLLRDFGVIVTLNVAIALLAALVVMPPLVVWADEKEWLGVKERPGAVKLAASGRTQLIGAAIAAVAVIGVGIGLYAAADTSSGETQEVAFAAVPLPTPTPAPTPTPEPAPAEDGSETAIDVTQFGTDRPEGLVGGILFDLLVGEGVDPQNAVCTAETLLSRTTEADLIASGLATFSDESLVPVIAAGLDCGVTQEQIDATIATARAG